MQKTYLVKFAGAIACAVMAASAANAATIDFGSGSGATPYVEDGFSFTLNRIVNGNCDSAGPCLGLNKNQTSVMSFTGGVFTLESFRFTLLGNGGGNTLTVFETNNASNAISFAASAYTHNTYYSALLGGQFSGVSSITFASTGGGNVRIDSLEASVVPVPAAGWLLGGGLLGLIGLARKRKITE